MEVPSVLLSGCITRDGREGNLFDEHGAACMLEFSVSIGGDHEIQAFRAFGNFNDLRNGLPSVLAASDPIGPELLDLDFRSVLTIEMPGTVDHARSADFSNQSQLIFSCSRKLDLLLQMYGSPGLFTPFGRRGDLRRDDLFGILGFDQGIIRLLIFPSGQLSVLVDFAVQTDRQLNPIIFSVPVRVWEQSDYFSPAILPNRIFSMSYEDASKAPSPHSGVASLPVILFQRTVIISPETTAIIPIIRGKEQFSCNRKTPARTLMGNPICRKTWTKLTFVTIGMAINTSI